MTEMTRTPGPVVCWAIASASTLQEVVESAGCPELFRRTLTGHVSWQARNRLPIEHVLTTPSAALSWFAALLALDAEVSVEGGANVPVRLLLDRRIKGRLQMLRCPSLSCDGAPLRGIRWGESHVGRTPSDEPIVSAVAVTEERAGAVTGARLALTGVWARRVGLASAASLLVGERLTADRIGQVATQVETEVAPKGDFLGSVEYRRAMAGVMARRALEECAKGHGAEHSKGVTDHGRQA